MGAPIDVAIVGAGIHGAAVAVRLLHDHPSLSLRLVDPAGFCLSAWKRRTGGQGMEFLRSPGAHHLDVDAESLLRYAAAGGRSAELAPPYRRPSLALFGDHARSVIARHRLDERVIAEDVGAIERVGEGYRLHARSGAVVDCRFVVVAPGRRGLERVPGWTSALGGRSSTHAEAADVARDAAAGSRILVVGGGLSAATIADAAVRRGARTTLTSRHRLETRLFDVDPGWLGPRYLRLFRAEPRPEARLRMIRAARGRGTITPELAERLRRHAASARLELREDDEVVEAMPRAGWFLVRFRSQPDRAERFDRAICATGYESSIAALDWLGALTRGPTCGGLPLVGASLEIAPDAFVSGWLAALELGPIAPNIAGARAAAARISAAIGERAAAGELAA